MKINKYLKEFGLLIKVVTKTIKIQEKYQKHEFLSTWLGTSVPSLLRHLLEMKCVIRAVDGMVTVGKDL